MLELTNVINISLSEASVGLGTYNVNNVALFTADAFLLNPDNDDYRVYVSAAAVAAEFGSGTETYQQALAVFSQNPNILAGGGSLIIFPLVGGTEALATAIARTKGMIFYCGIISTSYGVNSGWKALADTLQGYGDKILFLPSATYSDVAGVFTDIKAASDSNTRCLFMSRAALDARLFAAAYDGRALSVDFTGSNTAITMNLKQLGTILPDEGIDQTKWAALAAAGVDAYVNYAGVPAVVSNGANRYFDEVYNLVWLVSALKVAGFNALAQVSGKVPQTEPGMGVLKGAYRQVLEQAKNNGYIAPGAWTSAEWFGVQADMYNNIIERGYYIYSAPVNLQSAADRAARQAPLVQIGIKEAGAIHSSSVIVNINQ